MPSPTPHRRSRPGPRFAIAASRSCGRSRLAATFATQIVSVAVGWQVYDLTRDPFDLGLVGLVQFAPALLLVLVTGAAADRFNRRIIVAALPGRRRASAPLALLILVASAATISVGLDLRRALRLRRRPRLPQSRRSNR